jgi:hypothetical protein
MLCPADRAAFPRSERSAWHCRSSFDPYAAVLVFLFAFVMMFVIFVIVLMLFNVVDERGRRRSCAVSEQPFKAINQIIFIDDAQDAGGYAPVAVYDGGRRQTVAKP